METLFQRNLNLPFNNYFESIVEGLDIERPEFFPRIQCSAENAIKTLENHPL